MISEWQLQTAKNRLSHVVALAMREGPQAITLRGKPAAVVLSAQDYRRLIGAGGPLSEFFGDSPLRGRDLDLERSQDGTRNLAL